MKDGSQVARPGNMARISTIERMMATNGREPNTISLKFSSRAMDWMVKRLMRRAEGEFVRPRLAQPAPRRTRSDRNPGPGYNCHVPRRTHHSGLSQDDLRRLMDGDAVMRIGFPSASVKTDPTSLHEGRQPSSETREYGEDQHHRENDGHEWQGAEHDLAEVFHPGLWTGW